MKMSFVDCICSYRDLNFSMFNDGFRSDLIDLYKENQNPPNDSVKLQISGDLILIGRELKEKELVKYGLIVALSKSKNEVTTILKEVSSLLKETPLNL